MKRNMGYGAAHNVAIKMAMQTGARYHVVLNPDLKFEPDIIDKIAEFMDSDHNIVEVMPKVFYPDGEIQYLCKLLPIPFNLIFRRFIFKLKFVQKMDDLYILKNSNYNKILNVPCLSGCFMFLCMRLLKQYDLLFDERFHIYCEDIDFVRQLHKIAKTIYYPEVSIIHNHAKKSYQSKRMLFQHIKSAIQYFNKWGWFFDEERERMNSQVLDEIKRLSLNESEIKMNNVMNTDTPNQRNHTLYIQNKIKQG
jgi:GT2 family glycosyltransferase